MKNSMYLSAAFVGCLALCSAASWAEDRSARCGTAKAPENIEGQVVKVDMAQERLTMRTGDGTTHEFHAAKETLADYKAGDPIKARLRAASKCD